MRRVLLAVLMMLLVACGDPEDQSERFVRIDSPKASPSGEYTASVVRENDSTVLVVKDKAGVEVFRDAFGQASRASDAGGVTWLSDQDQLWVLSTDGHTYVERDSAGSWVRKPADTLPDELTRIG